MRVLITAGPTREPIDLVRFISNRSSGKMGLSLATAALAAGHEVMLILGPIALAPPPGIARVNVETAEQMRQAVQREFPRHDLLIMAAAVSDYRPRIVQVEKIARKTELNIECEATPDIVAEAGKGRRANQRIVGFSLESRGNVERAMQKLKRKNLDLIVYNPTETMESPTIEPVLLWRDGRSEALTASSKEYFAEVLIERSKQLFD